MSASNHKVGSPITVWQSLANTFINQSANLKQWWDQVGEIVRLKHDALCDYIDTDIATKAEIQGITLGQIADGTITEPKLSVAVQTKLVGINPAGSIIAMATSTVPNGYLECNGSAVSRTTYATLFSAIGTLYGSGDGSTTFNLPDLRGEFLRGWDNGRGVDTGRNIGTAQAGTKVGGIVSASDGEAPTDSVNGGSWSGSITRHTVRPRNIAIMYCIKH